MLCIKRYVLILLLVALGLPLVAKAKEPTESPDPLVYRQALVRMITEIPEFQWLAQTAGEYGVEVWLFGGSAASFAHYVRDHVLFESGVSDFDPGAFAKSLGGERSYLDIFLPVQDIDLVVDGPLESIKAFEQVVLGKFPEMQGNKKRWEVRALQEQYGVKEALLNNPDFIHQHTDSHSVGMIALSIDDSPEHLVRDLHDWDTPVPRFLQDVLAKELHYYYSSKHRETPRYRDGINPEILSVIRYFIKLFQYGLHMGENDRDKLQKIIHEFSPEGDWKHYVKAWFKHNIAKLFLHSLDVEYSWSMLKRVGLREKLLRFGHVNEVGSPAWWMNKSPLRSFDVGRGNGSTARELGIDKVIHETTDFSVWTIITRSRKGEANVFASRRGNRGEVAAYGGGFYTTSGKNSSFFGTDYSILFQVDPHARQGSDFEIYENNIVLVLNRRAIRFLRANIQVEGLLDYLKLVHSSHETWIRGFLDKIGRSLDHKYGPLLAGLSDQEKADAVKFVEEKNSFELWKRIGEFGFTGQYYRALRALLLSEERQDNLQYVFEHILARGHWAEHPELIAGFIQERGFRNTYLLEIIAESILSQPGWSKRLYLIKKLVKKADQGALQSVVDHILPNLEMVDAAQVVEWVVGRVDGSKGYVLDNMIRSVLARPGWEAFPMVLRGLIERADQSALLIVAQFVLARPHWFGHPQLVELLIARADIENGFVLEGIASHILSQEEWSRYPHLLAKVIARGDFNVLRHIIGRVLSQPFWLSHPQFPQVLEALIDRVGDGQGDILENIIELVFSRPEGRKYPHLVEKIIARGDQGLLQYLTRGFMVGEEWVENPQLVEALVRQNDPVLLADIDEFLLVQLHWKNNSRLLELSGGEVTIEGLQEGLQAVQLDNSDC